MFLISILSILIISCDNNDSAIRKDLDSRYTNFEIVKITKDTANVYTAIKVLRSIKIRVSETNLLIVKALYNDNLGDSTTFQNCQYIEKLQDSLVATMTKFENSKYDRVDPCFLVEYRISKDELKITKQEYYYINKYNGDVIHRAYD